MFTSGSINLHFTLTVSLNYSSLADLFPPLKERNFSSSTCTRCRAPCNKFYSQNGFIYNATTYGGPVSKVWIYLGQQINPLNSGFTWLLHLKNYYNRTVYKCIKQDQVVGSSVDVQKNLLYSNSTIVLHQPSSMRKSHIHPNGKFKISKQRCFPICFRALIGVTKRNIIIKIAHVI